MAERPGDIFGGEDESEFEIQTDILTLLENVRCEGVNQSGLKQAFQALSTICSNNVKSQDYFCAAGGIRDTVALLQDVDEKDPVIPAALFCLACAVEKNVSSQNQLMKVKFLSTVREFLSFKDKKVVEPAAFLLACAVADNGKGQQEAYESGCLTQLLSTLRNYIEDRHNEENKWLIITRAIGVCVNNPQNERNQRVCSSILPPALKLISSETDHAGMRHLMDLVSSVVANNACNQERLRKCGGLEGLVTLVKTQQDGDRDVCDTHILTTAVSTLDACISGNDKSCKLAGELEAAEVLLGLIKNFELDPSDLNTVLLALAHILEHDEKSRREIMEGEGRGLLVDLLTSSQDEDLFKTVKYTFALCRTRDTSAGTAGFDENMNLGHVNEPSREFMSALSEKLERLQAQLNGNPPSCSNHDLGLKTDQTVSRDKHEWSGSVNRNRSSQRRFRNGREGQTSFSSPGHSDCHDIHSPHENPKDETKFRRMAGYPQNGPAGFRSLPCTEGASSTTYTKSGFCAEPSTQNDDQAKMGYCHERVWNDNSSINSHGKVNYSRVLQEGICGDHGGLQQCRTGHENTMNKDGDRERTFSDSHDCKRKLNESHCSPQSRYQNAKFHDAQDLPRNQTTRCHDAQKPLIYRHAKFHDEQESQKHATDQTNMECESCGKCARKAMDMPNKDYDRESLKRMNYPETGFRNSKGNICPSNWTDVQSRKHVNAPSSDNNFEYNCHEKEPRGKDRSCHHVLRCFATCMDEENGNNCCHNSCSFNGCSRNNHDIISANIVSCVSAQQPADQFETCDHMTKKPSLASPRCETCFTSRHMCSPDQSNIDKNNSAHNNCEMYSDTPQQQCHMQATRDGGNLNVDCTDENFMARGNDEQNIHVLSGNGNLCGQMSSHNHSVINGCDNADGNSISKVAEAIKAGQLELLQHVKSVVGSLLSIIPGADKHQISSPCSNISRLPCTEISADVIQPTENEDQQKALSSSPRDVQSLTSVSGRISCKSSPTGHCSDNKTWTENFSANSSPVFFVTEGAEPMTANLANPQMKDKGLSQHTISQLVGLCPVEDKSGNETRPYIRRETRSQRSQPADDYKTVNASNKEIRDKGKSHEDDVSLSQQVPSPKDCYEHVFARPFPPAAHTSGHRTPNIRLAKNPLDSTRSAPVRPTVTSLLTSLPCGDTVTSNKRCYSYLPPSPALSEFDQSLKAFIEGSRSPSRVSRSLSLCTVQTTPSQATPKKRPTFKELAQNNFSTRKILTGSPTVSRNNLSDNTDASSERETSELETSPPTEQHVSASAMVLSPHSASSGIGSMASHSYGHKKSRKTTRNSEAERAITEESLDVFHEDSTSLVERINVPLDSSSREVWQASTPHSASRVLGNNDKQVSSAGDQQSKTLPRSLTFPASNGETQVNSSPWNGANQMCPGCVAEPELNSRTFNIAIETSKHTCQYHRQVRSYERELIRQKTRNSKLSGLKQSLVNTTNITTVSPISTFGDIYCFSSDEKEETSTPSLDVSLRSVQAAVNRREEKKKQTEAAARRSRVPYTEQELANLMEGVRSLGKRWQQILWTYEFHPSRTSVDLKDKYRRVMSMNMEESKQRRSSLPFSMCEIRRLKRGVKLFGYNWKAILAGNKFLPGRTAEDLRVKWRALNQARQ